MFHRAVRADQSHRCNAVGRTTPRTGIDLHCKDHLARGRRYGHPNAGPLHPKLWGSQRREISDLGSRNALHKDQLQGLEWLRPTNATADVRAFGA